MEGDITMAHFTMVSEDQVKYASKKNFNASPITGKAPTAKVDPQEVAKAQTAYDASFKANQLALHLRELPSLLISESCSFRASQPATGSGASSSR